MSTELVTTYLGLGSNLGNRRDNLDKALEYLSQRLRVDEASSVYETEPLGNTHQPPFLNMVIKVDTRLAPNELLLLLKGIERKLGRAPGKRNAPRPIDIDILFYGNQTIKTSELTIPHPRITERAFVLIPLAEIAPDLQHPTRRRSIKQLLKGLGAKQGVVKLQPGEEGNVSHYGKPTL